MTEEELHNLAMAGLGRDLPIMTSIPKAPVTMESVQPEIRNLPTEQLLDRAVQQITEPEIRSVSPAENFLGEYFTTPFYQYKDAAAEIASASAASASAVASSAAAAIAAASAESAEPAAS